MLEDTISAVCTSVGDGAISIIRVSGSAAVKEVSKIFSKDLNVVDSHTIHYGFINDNGEDIDEVLVSVMKAPKSFTTEDIVEISCHGGYAVTNKIFETVLKQDIRIAEPGEFTKRAFLNGRIDLVQAEAVSDLIKAKTDNRMKAALNSLKHEVSNDISTLRGIVLDIIANIEVNIDYPEYEDIVQLTNEILLPKINYVRDKIEELLSTTRTGKIIEDGLIMSIIGSPNVGKSSLLNKMIGEDKAIVTNIAGTTRDSIESEIIIDGVLFKLVDTAGIRKTKDVVENIGVEKSLNLLKKSDIVLFVIDNNKQVSDDEIVLLDQVKKINHIVVINKCDLDSKYNYDLSDFNKVEVSMLNDTNLKKIENKISGVLSLGNVNYTDKNVITKVRHIAHLNRAIKSINDILLGIDNRIEIDLISIDIRAVYYELGCILGYEIEDDILDKLFSEFCLGK
ncbi:MAG: tRNA uridine-5-carboxymethylaminomethyl(34) synthesis GTPase MnmE [Bacilli bacterium]